MGSLFRRALAVYNAVLLPLAAVGLAATAYTARHGGGWALYASILYTLATPLIAYVAAARLLRRGQTGRGM